MTQFDLLTYFSIICWFVVCLLVIYGFFVAFLLPHLYQTVNLSNLSGLLLWGRNSYVEVKVSFFLILLLRLVYGVIVTRVSPLFFWWVIFGVMGDLEGYRQGEVGAILLMSSFGGGSLVNRFSYGFFRFYTLVYFGHNVLFLWG